MNVEELVLELRERLHPSIKKALSTRGVKIFLNLYVGYDAEFDRVLGKFNTNEILSSQLAGNTAVYFKIPRKYEYEIEYINPASSKSSRIYTNGNRKNDLKDKIERSINALLNRRDALTREKY